MDRHSLILLTGGTGYVGGRLLQSLEEGGYRVRSMARRPEALQGWVGAVRKSFLATASTQNRLIPRWRECTRHTIWFIPWAPLAPLKKKIGKQPAILQKPLVLAKVRRIVYLGGLGEGALSRHLRSRQEVGEALLSAGIEVIEFRASIVIGSGSVSFEIVRALVERLPVMICPAWVSIAAQPIGIEDLVPYLLEALALPHTGNRIIEIGGADQVSYEEIMREYARQRNLRRYMISVPVLTPRLSSLWLGLITPVYARIGRKLIDSIRNPTVVRDPAACKLFSIRPKSIGKMIARAIVNEDREFASTKWSDALSSRGEAPSWGSVRFGNRFVDSSEIAVNVPADIAFRPIRRIGGKTGWYYGNWLWQGICHRRQRADLAHSSNRDLRSDRSCRLGILVRSLSDSQVHLFENASRHCYSMPEEKNISEWKT